MYIKQIIIQGFKSYKDQTIVDPFSPKHNVIVGRNGSGKSNFFAAIRFVLGDQYSQMSREERGALLHEGAGSAVMSAFVEIIIDDSEGRFHSSNEVVLRRSIGLKKDEYTLNRKNTTRTEVQGLLDTAGFSKSNPYYIVPQGRITHITNMKDNERLEMLKEVAGTRLYEVKRAESVAQLEKTASQRELIDEKLAAIREALRQLEEESNELKEYQQADRERRCLEYTIYHKEQEAYQEALEKLQGEREGGIEQTDDGQARLREAEANLEKLEAQVNELQQKLKLLHADKLQFEEDRNAAAKEKAAVEYDLQELQHDQQSAQSSRKEHAAELRNVKAQIAHRESELASVQPALQSKHEQARGVQQQLQQAESTRSILLAKQGRSARYRNKRERDDDLKRQIADINAQIRSRDALATRNVQDVSTLELEIQQSEADTTALQVRLDNRGGEQQDITAQTQQFKDEKDKLSERRKEIWREEARVESLLSNAKQETVRSETFLHKMMDQNTSRGLAAMRRYVQQHNIEGVYGTVGELLEFGDKYKTAVEVTAGTSLFHVIVDTDATASKLVELLQKDKAGRLTFMPLNRLHPKPIDLPNAGDAIPLMSRLRFDPTYAKAYEQIFGKTIICPDLTTASHYARSHGVSAITPGGDRSNKKGALSGGYHDTRSSRVDGLRRAKIAREELDDLNEKSFELRREREALEQQITKNVSELQKIEHRRAQAERGYAPLRQDIERRRQEMFRKQDDLESKRRRRENDEALGVQLRQQLQGFQAEMASAFNRALTDDDEQQLQVVGNALPALRAQYLQLSNEVSELEAKKQELDLELRENLSLRLAQLQTQDEDNSDGSVDGVKVQERQKDLARITKRLSTLNDNVNKQSAIIASTQEELAQTQTQHAEQQTAAEDMSRQLGNMQKSLAKSAQKRRILQARLDEVVASIRSLGALPDAAFNAPYTTMQNQTATTRLHKVQEALKKFGVVNKKAYEQYTQSNKMAGDLETSRKSLDNGDVKIRELIEHLDQQKDEAIERTFRQVSREFARVFEKLVPAGKGRLIIQRRTERAQADADASDDDEQHATSIENYTGVGISVSFNSKHDEQQRIQQLSGGQKSLCALTLIFAIQASDPAPFYLFDEIDANLDAQYRTAVADLIQESAETGQFICTTFRPEMLRVADKCYAVSQKGKASQIAPVEVEEALDFVEGQVAAT